MKRVEWLLTLLEATKNELRIVSGELWPFVYNNERLIKAIKEKLKVGVEIKIITGPVIYGDKEGKNLLWELIKNNNNFPISLGFLNKRPLIHFKIGDKKHLLVESPHQVFDLKRKIKFIENSSFEGPKYWELFGKMWAESLLPIETKVSKIIKIKGQQITRIEFLSVS